MCGLVQDVQQVQPVQFLLPSLSRAGGGDTMGHVGVLAGEMDIASSPAGLAVEP